jgi:adenosylhomocysteine nucleosidase
LILVFYAFARELGPFKRGHKSGRAIDDPHLRGFRARIGATEIVAVATGIGFTRTQTATRRAFELFPGAELVLGTGVVGALSAGLSAGDLIMADRILTTRAGDNGAASSIAAIDDATLSELGRYLRAAGINYSTGALLTSHRVLGNSTEKHAAHRATGAIAVDMESAALAVEAHERGLRFAVVRAVMDSVEDAVVGAEMADENGIVRPAAAANFLIRNPAAVMRIPRMMQSLSRATRSLSTALEAIAGRGRPERR